MPDYYHAPALILTLLLLPAFGYLYLRSRNMRTLLWFLGFLFAFIQMFLHYDVGPWNLSENAHPWLEAFSQISILISSALFLASLSPISLRIGRFKVLYVVPFTIPLVIYAVFLYGVFHGIVPSGPGALLFPALGFISAIAAFFWGAQDRSSPAWLGGGVCGAACILALWLCLTHGAAAALSSVECSVHFVTGLLIIFLFRRFSPGIVLSVLGFTAWSLHILEVFASIVGSPMPSVNLIRIIVMGSVVAALGMILLALEDELSMNKVARERERRAHLELEAYTKLVLTRRRIEDFDRQGAEVCQTVVEHSRFAQAALLLQNSGRYCLAGAAGLDAATAMALDELAARIPVAGFLETGSAPSAVDQSQTLRLDLTPWLTPGDDLKRLRFTSVLAVPMMGRSVTEGALLLAGMRPAHGHHTRPSSDPLRADDLLPIEMLAARLQATRSQTRMLEKLIDSDKFAGLGQLAAKVTQQLNNPLTVILGYASLLSESSLLDPNARKSVEFILTEARRMKSTLESLSRISRPQSDLLAPVSVAELLADMEELHRPELLNRSIELRLNIAPSLPNVLGHAQQLRQAVMHCLQFAMDAVDSPNSAPGLDLATAPAAEEPRTIRLEATSEGKLVHILVAHSGPGFIDPNRAFDPFLPAQAEGEIAGLGLSLCASILRGQNGRATAVNLEPGGAAILLELRAA